MRFSEQRGEGYQARGGEIMFNWKEIENRGF